MKIASLIFAGICFLSPFVSFAETFNETSQSLQNPHELQEWLEENFRYQRQINGADQSLQETIRLRRGDCEDFAVLVRAILQEMGISSQVAVVTFKGLRVRHAVCLWKDENGFYNFFSNRTLFFSRTKTQQEAIDTFYPDWERIILVDEQGEHTGVLTHRNKRKALAQTAQR